jgi:hypothetical protein
MITPATIAALSTDEIDALGEYAFPGLSIPGDWPQAVLNSLVDKGLLIRHRRQHPSPGLPVIVEDYEVPLAVHIAYCEWCGTEPTESIESMIVEAIENLGREE